ncbi:hypothetical protein WJX77_002139 [Trebouxia sp. C0004]
MHASVTAVSWFCRPFHLSQHPSRRVLASAQDHTQSGKQEVPSTSLEFLQQLGKDEGFRVELAEEEEDAETWEDAMDEMEDVWMREPAGESFAELSRLSSGPKDEMVTTAVPIITTDELQAMVAQDYDATLLIVDVRSSEEFTHSHVSEAQSVPLQQLDSSIANEWRSMTVVVTGSGDTRSQQACTRLSKVYKLMSVFHLIPDVV